MRIISALRTRIANSQRVTSWLSRRLPRVHAVTLTQRQIFIFLSREGLLFVGLLLILFITGINYGNNLVLGLCFYLSGVLVVSIHYTYAQLSGLYINIGHVCDSSAGMAASITLQLQATGSKPHHQIKLTWQAITAPDNRQQRFVQSSSAPLIVKTIGEVLQPLSVTLHLPTPTRGKYQLPRLKISSVYPLGLLRAWTYVYFDAAVWVYPSELACVLTAVESIDQPNNQQDHGSVRGQDDFDMLAPYVAGEAMSRIAWQQLAQGKGLLTKRFSSPVSTVRTLHYQQMPASAHEERLSQLAYWATQYTEQQQPFSLVIDHTQQITEGQGDTHLMAVRLMLAEVAS